MPVIYLVQQLDDQTGHPFINETGFAGADLKTVVRYLLEGQFGGRFPIQAIYRFDMDAMAIEDASERVLMLLDSEAERLGRDLPEGVTDWMDARAVRKAAACMAAMAPLSELLAAIMG